MDSPLDIKKMAKRGSDFRRVIATGKRSQLVLMSIPPGEDIGSEVHPDTDQILFVFDGEGRVIVNGQASDVEKHDVVFVPAGTEHNLVNTEDDEDLKIATIYSPPEYADGTVHRSKADAMAEVFKKEPVTSVGAGTTAS